MFQDLFLTIVALYDAHHNKDPTTSEAILNDIFGLNEAVEELSNNPNDSETSEKVKNILDDLISLTQAIPEDSIRKLTQACHAAKNDAKRYLFFFFLTNLELEVI